MGAFCFGGDAGEVGSEHDSIPAMKKKRDSDFGIQKSPVVKCVMLSWSLVVTQEGYSSIS